MVTNTAETFNETEVQMTREMIIHLLGIYPIVSNTMLQSGLGPAVKPVLWRPILGELIEEGVVIRDQETLQTPYGRYNSYTKLSLSDDSEGE